MQNEKGQALIELALAVFILFMVLFGITEWGTYIFERNTLNSAARAAVRRAIVQTPLVQNDATIQSFVQSDILNDPGIVVCVCINLTAGNTCIDTTTVLPTCTVAESGPAINGDRITVGVGDTFTIVTGTLVPFFNGARAFGADASMRYEL